MSAEQCPNCGKYTFKKELSNKAAGCLLVLIGIAGPNMLLGGAAVYGGTIVGIGIWGIIGLILAAIGLVMFISDFFSQKRTIKYNCNECKFSETYLLKETTNQSEN